MAHLLLDENLPRLLLNYLAPHTGSTVAAMRWSGTKNGALLRRAESEFDALVTADRGIQFQQHIAGLNLSVIVLRARSTKIDDLIPLAPQIVAAADQFQPGTLVELEYEQA